MRWFSPVSASSLILSAICVCVSWSQRGNFATIFALLAKNLICVFVLRFSLAAGCDPKIFPTRRPRRTV